MDTFRFRRLAVAGLAACVLGAAPAFASDDASDDRGNARSGEGNASRNDGRSSSSGSDWRRDGRHHGDHDLAHRALEQGQVLPLRAVLDKLEREYQGQVLKVEFEHDDGRFLYKLRLLQKDGRVVMLEVDAVDGAVLRVKRRER